MTTKRVGDTLTIHHLPDKRGLRIVEQRTGKAVFIPLSLARALSSALLDAAADVAGEWEDMFLNLSSEMAGAFVTYFLLVRILGHIEDV